MRIVVSLGVLLSLACGGAPDDGQGSGASAVVEEWRLSAEPVLEIGVVEGDEEYQLHSAVSSRVLPDGRIAVVNAGSAQVRFYDLDSGAYLDAFGAAGDGPGEFRNAARIHLWDSGLRVWDSRLSRFSYHGMDGEHQRVERLEFDIAEPFPADVWIYRRHLIDSPVEPTSRGGLTPGIDALPAVDSAQAVRYVRVTEQGRFWTSDEPLPSEEPVSVRVYELDGAPLAELVVPARFEPHDIGPDYVLGRAFDDLDVNYIRLLRLEKPEGSGPGQGLGRVRTLTDSSADYSVGEIPDDVRPTIVGMIKNLASRQEMNYASSMSYTRDVDELELSIPDGIRVDFLEATPRGWTGLITHVESGAYCVLSYGFNVPMGWRPGSVVCPAMPPGS